MIGMMKETLKHQQAFEIYYQMGDARNYVDVAHQVGVSRTSIEKWGKEFKWQDRVAERDAENAKRLRQITDDAIIKDKQNYREIIKASLEIYVQKLKQGKIKIDSTQDLVRLMEMDLKILNDKTGTSQSDIADDIVTQINIFNSRLGDTNDE